MGNGECSRVILPISSVCNMQCVFCQREGFCRSLTSNKAEIPALSAQQALYYLQKMIQQKTNLKSVIIAGPGEVLLEIEKLQELAVEIKKEFPQLSICLQTNGLLMEEYADLIADIGIKNIILNINALNKDIATQMYNWVRIDKHIYRGDRAAEIITKRQKHAMQICSEKGFKTRLHVVYVPWINDPTIVEIARKAAEMNVQSFSCSLLDPNDKSQLEAIRKQCSRIIDVKCADTSIKFDSEMDLDLLASVAAGPIDPIQKRPYFAVGTLDGVCVNRHLGQASELKIYQYVDGVPVVVESRKTPKAGGGSNRWKELADILSDCSAILVTDAGSKPLAELPALGLKVVRTEDDIATALDALACEKTICPTASGKPRGCTPLDCSTCSGC